MQCARYSEGRRNATGVCGGGLYGTLSEFLACVCECLFELLDPLRLKRADRLWLLEPGEFTDLEGRWAMSAVGGARQRHQVDHDLLRFAAFVCPRQALAEYSIAREKSSVRKASVAVDVLEF